MRYTYDDGSSICPRSHKAERVESEPDAQEQEPSPEECEVPQPGHDSPSIGQGERPWSQYPHMDDETTLLQATGGANERLD